MIPGGHFTISGVSEPCDGDELCTEGKSYFKIKNPHPRAGEPLESRSESIKQGVAAITTFVYIGVGGCEEATQEPGDPHGR